MGEPPSATRDNPKITRSFDVWMKDIQLYLRHSWSPHTMIESSETYTKNVIEALEARIEWGQKNNNQLVIDGATEKLAKAKIYLQKLTDQPPSPKDTAFVCMSAPYG